MVSVDIDHALRNPVSALARAERTWIAGVEFDRDLRARFVKWLRKHGLGSAKRLARDFSVSASTARHWLIGTSMPSPATRLLMLHHWGAMLLAEVVAPDDMDVRAEALKQDIENHERYLAKMRRELKAMEGGCHSGFGAVSSGFPDGVSNA